MVRGRQRRGRPVRRPLWQSQAETRAAWSGGGAGEGEAVRLVVDLEAEGADVLTSRTQEVKTVTPAWDWAPSAGLRGAVGSTQRGPSGPGPVGRQRRRCVSGGRGPSGGLGSSPPRRDEVLQEPRAALWAEEAVNTGGTAQERGRPWPSGERTSRGRERPPGSRAATRPRETRAGNGPVALCKEVWGGRDCSLSGRWP